MNSTTVSILLHAIIGFLSTTIKNPSSSRAQNLRGVIKEARDAFDAFLAATALAKE